mmetsp:Transcript_30443/g.59597  ORF Transcript_30443/g.59597 Transcript_30443/m.59597 type:complete len:640 (-) Transcript_30443:198-2117(-)
MTDEKLYQVAADKVDRNVSVNSSGNEYMESANALLEEVKKEGKHYTLSFSDVRVSVSIPSWVPAFATPGVPGTTVEILKGIDGEVSSGELLAILGASGSGKTTLLNRLAMMPLMDGGKFSGSVTVNGLEVTDGFFTRHCAFIHHDDRLWSALTVYENVNFAAKLYCPELSSSQRERRVKRILKATGLHSCANTKAGNIFIDGVSTGQRRRLSIAVELMGSPDILFVDEPTHGLDSKSASEIMTVLGSLARDANVAVICSIHKPATRTFMAFDKALILSKGQTAYFGPTRKATDYFADVGFELPPRTNPADFFLEITNPDFAGKAQVNKIISTWQAQQHAGDVENASTVQTEATASASERPSYASSYPWQMCVVMHRLLLSYSRDPGSYIGRGIMFSSMSIIFGIIFLGLQRNQESVLDYLFSMTFMLANASYMTSIVMHTFKLEVDVLAKEVRNGMYAPVSYAIASSLVQMPFVFFITIMATVPSYWLTGYNDDPARFFQFLGMVFLFLYLCESIGLAFASAVSNLLLAIGSVVSLLSVLFVFNGLFVTPEKVTWALRWIRYVSPHYYVMIALGKISFAGTHWSGYQGCMQACYGETGDEVLDAVQGMTSSVNFAKVIGVLLAEIVVLRIFYWLMLRKQ